MGSQEKRSPPSNSFERLAGIKSSSLLRGIALHRAMWRLGALFSTASSASAATASSDPSFQSVKTAHLQDFISHNWVTSRPEKFLCLAVHYNIPAATCACWGVAALCCILTLSGVFPVDMPPNSFPTCFASTLGGQAAFFLMFFGAQDVRHLLYRAGLAGQGRLVFVDKACISQVDPERKREGIENLAGFILASQNIVVVLGPEYLYKLWTVYELATFVMSHQDHTRIKVIPTLWLRQHGVIIIGLSLAQVLYFSLYFSLRLQMTALLSYLLAAALFVVVGGHFARKWQRQLADITAAIEEFSIRKTNCAVESDRTQVQENVRVFLHCLGRVSAETGEDALGEFDKLVREVLPRALDASIGSMGTPYSHLVACTSVFMGSALDAIAGRTRAGSPLPGALAAVVFHISGCLTLLPLAIILVEKILARRLDLRGCVERLFIAAALLPGLAIYFIAYALQFMATRRAQQGDVWAWAYCAALLAYCALAAVAAIAVFVPARRSKAAAKSKQKSHNNDNYNDKRNSSSAVTVRAADAAQQTSSSASTSAPSSASPSPSPSPEASPSRWRERCLTSDRGEIAQVALRRHAAPMADWEDMIAAETRHKTTDSISGPSGVTSREDWDIMNAVETHHKTTGSISGPSGVTSRADRDI